MLRVAVAAVVAFCASPAFAADQVLRGPAPDWVKPLEVSTPALDSTGPAVRILLQDRQLNFTTQGDSEFVEQVMQVRSPQGLAGLGNVSLAWNPDTDTVTVHHLRVRRHAETIDLLARQSFTVIRREAGLERAIVDGVLTATLQPEGLQVGDVVDMAYTVTRLDPVLQGRSERTTMLPPNTAVDRVRVRAVWDASRPLQWRAGEGLGKVKVGKSDGRVELVADLKDPPPLKFVPNVPVRFYPLRELSVSEFRDWSEISALMAPHFAKTSTLSPDSPLRAEVAKIRAASSNPNVQAAAALRLVEDQVRYLALVLNLGGYVPATADQTWARRYGDCKAKTVLLMALLHELGIEAEAALVSSSRGDGLDTRLPTLAAFDHVIVRATIAGKIYWLDGTRTGDRSLDTLRAPPFLWALPLRDKDATLVAIDQPPLGEPDTYTRLQIDASAGLDPPAPVRGEKTMSQAMNVLLGSGVTIPGLDRDKMLRQLWSSYSWIEIKSITAQTDERGVTRVLLEGTATLPFDRQAGGRSLRLREADLGAYLSLRDKDDPYPDASYPVSGYPSYEAFNLAITLPRDREGFRFEGDDVDAKVAGRAFTRKLRIEKGVATIETTERTLVREISASDARAAKPALDDLAKVRVALRAPGAYRPTPQDVAAWGRQSPDTVAGLIERGNRFLSDARNADAMADFEKAVSLDPQNSFAYANRAIGHYYGGRTDAAKADLAQAQVLDPRNYVALHAAGLIAMRENRFADAAAAFGRAADLRAGNTFALTSLIRAYVAMDDTDKALAALAELQRIAPGQGDAVTFRFNILTSAGRYAEALADVDAGLAKTPDDPELHLSRATALMLLNRRDEGYRAFARAIELKPTAMAYLTRASYRAPADIAGRLADIDAAAKLEPEMMAVVARRADALGDSGRHEEALAGLATALKAHPDNDDLLMARADVHLRAGRTAIATKAFAAIRAGAARDAQQLNALCWQQAIRGFALETALADCDAALKLEPGRADALDSRAFVLMRLGRLTEAVAAYDTALKARPRLAESLYGRALARLRLNDLARGESDLAAARASDPQIEATFATYGVMLPTPAPPPRT